MEHELFKRVSQSNSGTQNAETERMEEVADWLQRSNTAGTPEHHREKLFASPHGLTLPEHIAAEQYAIEHGLWIDDDSLLGTMGPSGDENNCYYNEEGSIVYKVNMLTHTGERILPVFNKIKMHNLLFPETSYKFVGFTNLGFTRSAFPVFCQYYIQNAENAHLDEIARHMESLGFMPTDEKSGGWKNETYLVWDLLPKNVLVDRDGDIYVIDAEIRKIEP